MALLQTLVGAFIVLGMGLLLAILLGANYVVEIIHERRAAKATRRNRRNCTHD